MTHGFGHLTVKFLGKSLKTTSRMGLVEQIEPPSLPPETQLLGMQDNGKTQAKGRLKPGAPSPVPAWPDSTTGKHQRCVAESGRNASPVASAIELDGWYDAR